MAVELEELAKKFNYAENNPVGHILYQLLKLGRAAGTIPDTFERNGTPEDLATAIETFKKQELSAESLSQYWKARWDYFGGSRGIFFNVPPLKVEIDDFIKAEVDTGGMIIFNPVELSTKNWEYIAHIQDWGFHDFAKSNLIEYVENSIQNDFSAHGWLIVDGKNKQRHKGVSVEKAREEMALLNEEFFNQRKFPPPPQTAGSEYMGMDLTSYIISCVNDRNLYNNLFADLSSTVLLSTRRYGRNIEVDISRDAVRQAIRVVGHMPLISSESSFDRYDRSAYRFMRVLQPLFASEYRSRRNV